MVLTTITPPCHHQLFLIEVATTIVIQWNQGKRETSMKRDKPFPTPFERRKAKEWIHFQKLYENLNFLRHSFSFTVQFFTLFEWQLQTMMWTTNISLKTYIYNHFHNQILYSCNKREDIYCNNMHLSEKEPRKGKNITCSQQKNMNTITM